MNHVIYDIFYGEIQLPSEHQVYMPYINLPALIGMLDIYIYIYIYIINEIHSPNIPMRAGRFI